MRIPQPHLTPIWRESAYAFELRALKRSAVWRGDGVEDAGGRPVLLVPGFLAGDGSLGVMTEWLRHVGYRTTRAGIRANVGCSEAVAAHLETRLERMADRANGKVAILGQSRGGLFAKVLAARRPDLVSGIVTLGSPLTDMFAVHPLVLANIGVVGALGSLSVPGLLTASCLHGTCCSRFREDLEAPFPDEVGFLSVYSKVDGIVDWRACLDPDADERLEVRSSHCGMSVNSRAYRATHHALEAFAAGHGEPRGAARFSQAA